MSNEPYVIANTSSLSPELQEEIKWTCAPCNRNLLVSQISKESLLVPDRDGLFPIHRAVMDKHYPLIDYALEAGVDIDMKTVSLNFTHSPLALAIMNGDYLMVEFLLSRGAVINEDCLSMAVASLYKPSNLAVFKLVMKGKTGILKKLFASYDCGCDEDLYQEAVKFLMPLERENFSSLNMEHVVGQSTRTIHIMVDAGYDTKPLVKFAKTYNYLKFGIGKQLALIHKVRVDAIISEFGSFWSC